MCAPENKELFDTAVAEYGHLGWSKVRDRLVSYALDTTDSDLHAATYHDTRCVL